MASSDQPHAGDRVPATHDGVTREQGARFLTIDELSKATTLSVSTIRRLVKKGAIVSYQLGGPRHRIMFPTDAIEQATKSAEPPDAQSAPNNSRSGAMDRPLRGPQPKWLRPS